MYQIALCEDEKLYAEAQTKLCREIMDRMNVPCRITVFSGADGFLDAFLRDGKRYDLILLDIVMDGMNGMELAGKIRESDKETAIVFLTSNPDYVYSGYDVKALHYLMKPADPGKLEQLIKAVYEEKYQARWFLLKSGAHNQRIAVKDIIALEIAGKKVAITATEGMFHYSGKLTDLLEELPGGHFVRCHQAFAVNINNIQEFDRFGIIAKNGKRIPISRPYVNDVKTAFLMHMKDNG